MDILNKPINSFIMKLFFMAGGLFLLSVLILSVLVVYYTGAYELLYSGEKIELSDKIEDKTTTIQELETSYLLLRGAKGSPKVLFLHGWAGSYDQKPMRGILTAFSKQGYTAIAIEMPGMGRSETPSEPWTNEDYADYIKGFVDEVEFSDFVLVGQSFGGGVAARYAEKYPETLDSLVLVNAATNDKSKGKKQLIDLWGDLFPKIVKSNWLPQGFKRFVSRYMLRLPDEVLDRSELINKAEIMSKTFRYTHSEDMLNLLKKIDTRTLLVWGKSDRKIPLSNAKQMEEKLPNVLLVTLEGGHIVIYQKPQETVKLIESNLKRID